MQAEFNKSIALDRHWQIWVLPLVSTATGHVAVGKSFLSAAWFPF